VKNPVGPIFRMGDEVEQVIAAIEDDNPDTEIEVIDRGSYVRVQGEDRVVLTLDTLRGYLGQDYEIRSLEKMMPSFAGRIITSTDSITWEGIAVRRRALAGEGATP
jgi:toluene monooxygenase system protein D